MVKQKPTLWHILKIPQEVVATSILFSLARESIHLLLSSFCKNKMIAKILC